MAREARLHVPHSLYHISLKANAQQQLFLDKQDGQYFYQLLADGKAKYGHDVLAFCLMDDHIHLAIHIASEPVSKIIHNLTFRYTRHFNRRHQRHGHLFVGRYKATIVQAKKYLPDLIRYIHLTPIRLLLTHKPEDYLWSSHRAYLHKEQITWLSMQALTRYFDDEDTLYSNYQEYIAAGMKHGRPKDLAAAKFTGRVFGDAEFITQVLAVAAQETKRAPVSLNELLAMVCHQYALTEDELTGLGKQRSTSTARGVLAYLVKQCPNITFTELAKKVNRDATTLSAHATRVEKQCKNDLHLAEFIQKMKIQIIK